MDAPPAEVCSPLPPQYITRKGRKKVLFFFTFPFKKVVYSSSNTNTIEKKNTKKVLCVRNTTRRLSLFPETICAEYTCLSYFFFVKGHDTKKILKNRSNKQGNLADRCRARFTNKKIQQQQQQHINFCFLTKSLVDKCQCFVTLSGSRERYTRTLFLSLSSSFY